MHSLLSIVNLPFIGEVNLPGSFYLFSFFVYSQLSALNLLTASTTLPTRWRLLFTPGP